MSMEISMIKNRKRKADNAFWGAPAKKCFIVLLKIQKISGVIRTVSQCKILSIFGPENWASAIVLAGAPFVTIIVISADLTAERGWF